MKIAVVSTGRSRCTLLAHYLHSQYNDLEYCREFYTERSWKNETDLELLTAELLAKENYIAKIMSLNLYRDYDPLIFKFEEYDQLHLVERPDFFQQCCSWHVARTHGFYHKFTDNEFLGNDLSKTHGDETFNTLSKQQGKIQLDKIKEYAKYVDNYLRFKEYIVGKDLDYKLYTYEDVKQYDKKQTVLQDSNLDYSTMIKNYHLKDAVNEVFNKHFSYENVTYDLEGFNAEISDLKGLRSLQSFASKMNTQWTK